MVAFPIWVLTVIYHERNSLDSKPFEEVYLPLIEGDFKPQINIVFSFTFYFFLRRGLIAVIVVTLVNYPGIQCLTMLLFSGIN